MVFVNCIFLPFPHLGHPNIFFIPPIGQVRLGKLGWLSPLLYSTYQKPPKPPIPSVKDLCLPSPRLPDTAVPFLVVYLNLSLSCVAPSLLRLITESIFLETQSCLFFFSSPLVRPRLIFPGPPRPCSLKFPDAGNFQPCTLTLH